jgi:hypothetical protein
MLIKVFVANFVRAANLKHKEKDSSWTKAKEGFVTVNVDVGFFFLIRGKVQWELLSEVIEGALLQRVTTIDYALDVATCQALAVRYVIYLAR